MQLLLLKHGAHYLYITPENRTAEMYDYESDALIQTLITSLLFCFNSGTSKLSHILMMNVALWLFHGAINARS